MAAHKFRMPELHWWRGVVEDRTGDPEKLGRVKVRIFGYHSKNKTDISTDQLMWAVMMNGITSGSISGIGWTPLGLMNGSHVIGFYEDGEDAQVPIIIGSYGAKPAEKGSGEGFEDPDGVYPKYPPGEQDTNRLARNEHTDETIVQKKKDDRDLQVDTALAHPNWDEPETPYAAEYPYNKVMETETGHVVEWDDTGGAERIGQWHRAETWYEIGPEGTMVEKIQKDNYQIIAGDDYLHVKGNVRITVEQDAHILVKGDANLEIVGDKKELVHGDSKLQINGSYDVLVKGNHRDWSEVHRSIDAPRVDINLPTPPPPELPTSL